MQYRVVLLFICAMILAPSVHAYDPQFSVGFSGSQRDDVLRYGGSAEYYTENLMLGGFLGVWPRLDFDTNLDQHALFLNLFTVAGIINLEYGYSTGIGSTYGVEFNSRFIPAVFVPALSSDGSRILRNLEIFFRAHKALAGGKVFYQSGLKLVFHFPGFKSIESS